MVGGGVKERRRRRIQAGNQPPTAITSPLCAEGLFLWLVHAEGERMGADTQRQSEKRLVHHRVVFLTFKRNGSIPMVVRHRGEETKTRSRSVLCTGNKILKRKLLEYKPLIGDQSPPLYPDL